ncbi:hypothetical protein BCR37DRAFT_395966 [Protomyces lactucae-debilis]|uniref:Uncharacterized protein n=1 Tax=Protomyces lactucae-debilis TaxID=2754530 RepID=A0A1Y2EPJ0_PROLT|nr:uncharacterized protein BCR37DRAFT_395966 [Protomyces lactucae-debilis]ORY73462.1 hypothetical protein BCR37DRAFT_395966 [Protomyces lactucae-debilis]
MKKGDRLSDFFKEADTLPSPIEKQVKRRTRKQQQLATFDPDVHGLESDSSGDDEVAFLSNITFSPIKAQATRPVHQGTPAVMTTATPKRDYEVIVDYDSDGTGFAFSPVKFTPAPIKRRVNTPAPAASRGAVIWDSAQRRVVARDASIVTHTRDASQRVDAADPYSPQAVALSTHLGLSPDTTSSSATTTPEQGMHRAIYARPRGPHLASFGKRQQSNRLVSITQHAPHVRFTRSISGQRPAVSLETLPIPAACIPKPPTLRPRTQKQVLKIPLTQPRSPRFALDALKASRERAALDAAKQQSLQALAVAANTYASHVLDDMSPTNTATPRVKSTKRRRCSVVSQEEQGRPSREQTRNKRIKRESRQAVADVAAAEEETSHARQTQFRASMPLGKLMQPIMLLSPAARIGNQRHIQGLSECRMADLENSLPHQHTAKASHQAPQVDFFSTGSAHTTPSSSPSVLPTTKSNAPSLPLLSSSCERFLLSRPAESAAAATAPARRPSFPPSMSGENTSVWRHRNLLYYTA